VLGSETASDEIQMRTMLSINDARCFAS